MSSYCFPVTIWQWPLISTQRAPRGTSGDGSLYLLSGNVLIFPSCLRCQVNCIEFMQGRQGSVATAIETTAVFSVGMGIGFHPFPILNSLSTSSHWILPSGVMLEAGNSVSECRQLLFPSCLKCTTSQFQLSICCYCADTQLIFVSQSYILSPVKTR